MSQSWRPSQGPRQSQHSGPQPPYGPPDPSYGRPGPSSGGRPQPDYGYGEYGGSGYGEQGDAGYGPPDPGYGGSNPGYGPPGYGYRSVPSRPGPQSGWPPAQDDSGWGGAGAQPPGRYAEYPEYSQYPQAPYQQYQQGQQYQQAPYGQYPGHPYDDPTVAPAGPYGYARPRQPSRSRGWVLPLVIMLLVFLAVGVGAAYALTRTLAATSTTAQSTATTATSKTPGAIPAGFKAYSEPAAHVKFAIPNGWTTQGTAVGASGLIVLSPDESSAFIVKQYPGTLDKVSAATGGLAGAAGSSGTVSNKQGPTTVNLAGASWVQESADITRDGQTLHMVILVTNHGGASYAFGYFAYKSSFASANTRYFQPAQASFTFI